MPYLDYANVACGFHASDPDVMRKTTALCARLLVLSLFLSRIVPLD